ncbi:MAG: hypothetical protein RML12_10085 [Xanthomonadales bacterium]|nr:hypothetical protein [Xanthomonadales bacterium]
MAVETEEALAVIEHDQHAETREPVGEGGAAVGDGPHRAARRRGDEETADATPGSLLGAEAAQHLPFDRPGERFPGGRAAASRA